LLDFFLKQLFLLQFLSFFVFIFNEILIMNILHVSAECFPMAKVGGLADVVGALPKYQNALGHDAKVIMPMHKTTFLLNHDWEVIHESNMYVGINEIHFTIIRACDFDGNFELYCLDIQGILDRDRVYGYDDDSYRYLVFQLAVLHWVNSWGVLPDVVHVHDHHAGLIPFMMRHVYVFSLLKNIKCVLTIHNAQYQGWMNAEMLMFFPHWDNWKTGLLMWNGQINSLACAVKCSDKITTVSPSYMQQLSYESNGLESLFQQEGNKCKGIINGIDADVWNPQTDKHLFGHYGKDKIKPGKQKNKVQLCKQFDLDEKLPLFIFIGRLVDDKGADLLPAFISQALKYHPNAFNFIVLGSGHYDIEKNLESVLIEYPANYRLCISYNEPLSHQLYAGADFLLMPSRVEPCGLNQLYALRYGTIPMVRRTGGLQDTVMDFGDDGGFGICFNKTSLDDMLHALQRALELYTDSNRLENIRKKMMNINHSWEQSAQEYIELYQ